MPAPSASATPAHSALGSSANAASVTAVGAMCEMYVMPPMKKSSPPTPSTEALRPEIHKEPDVVGLANEGVHRVDGHQDDGNRDQRAFAERRLPTRRRRPANPQPRAHDDQDVQREERDENPVHQPDVERVEQKARKPQDLEHH